MTGWRRQTVWGVLIGVVGWLAMAQAEDFNDYLNEAKQMPGQGTAAVQTLDPTTVPQYTDNPSQSQYDTGVTQAQTDMAEPAQTAEQTNEATQAVYDDSSTRARYTINPKAEAIVNSKYIQTNANDIEQGDESHGVVCNDGQGTPDTKTTKNCTLHPNFDRSCTQTLVATVTYPWHPAVCQHVILQKGNATPPPGGQLAGQFAPVMRATYYVFLVNGPDGAARCYRPGSLLIAQKGVGGQAAWVSPANVAEQVTVVSVPSTTGAGARATATTNGAVSLQLAVQAPNSGVGSASGNINQSLAAQESDGLTLVNTGPYAANNSDAIAWDTVPLAPPPVVTEQWVDHCGSLTPMVQSGVCTFAQKVCTQGAETKTINGVPVTADCWEKTATYHCGEPDDGSCQVLLDQGCSQQTSQCSEQASDGTCLAFDESFVCTVPGQPKVVCGQPTYCDTGDCAPPDQDQNQDFDQAAAGMATVDAEGEAVYNSQSQTTFQGDALGCENDGVGFSNCCRQSGWGQDVHLAHCTDEEKKLGHDREKQLTTFIGTKCEKRNTFGCYLYKKMYCVWPSLLSRDVQEQGRQGQLHRGFGSPDHPDCSGVSVEEIQQMDFNQIDFSNAYSEIENNTDLPDTDTTEQQVEDEAEQMEQGGQA